MKDIRKNIICGFGGQLLSMAISIILPRVIILNFGSETNGITSAITQIFVYIALLEAGIGSAALTRLYKDIAENERERISGTVSAAHKYYRKSLPLYIGSVVILAGFYPSVIDTTIPAETVRFLILIQGLCGTVNFLFSNAYIQLLTADGRNYVVSVLSLLVKVVSVCGQLLLIAFGFNIVSVQLSALLAATLQAVIVNVYIKKNYPWLILDRGADVSKLSQRRAFLVHEISGVVFQSTDIVLISVFCSMTEASVYTVYNMIFSALGNLLSVLMRSLEFKLGAAYHQDMDKYTKMHDFVEALYICFVFAVISAAYVVTIPFIRLYTADVTDASYVRPMLPLLFSGIQLLSCGRRVCSQLISISGRAKDTIPNTLTEMAINLVVSVVLAKSLGIVGVLLGTILALCYRTNDMLFYANRKILNRGPRKVYFTLLVNLFVFAMVVVITGYHSLEITNYFAFVIQGFLILVLSFALYFGIQIALNGSFRENLRAFLSKN